MSDIEGADNYDFDRLLSDEPVEAVASQNPALAIWNKAAASLEEEPDYKYPVTQEEYLASQRPGTSKRIEARLQSGKEPRRGQRRVMQRYAEQYDGYVLGIDAKNEDRHTSWRGKVGNMLGEAFILAALADDASSQDVIRGTLRNWSGATHDRSALGMGYLALGKTGKAKDLLLGATDDSKMHAHDLLDAYTYTQDEDYRNVFISRASWHPYLFARLVTAEQAWRQPDTALLDHAPHLGAQIAVAAAIARTAPESAAAEKAAEVLRHGAQRLQPPVKKYITPKDRATQSIKDDGIFGIVDATLDTVDVLIGDAPREKTAEYRRFLKDSLPVFMTVRPLLNTESDYSPRLTHSELRDVDNDRTYLGMSDWGDAAAGTRLLESNTAGKARNGFLALYRNVLRDIGPVAATRYIQFLPTNWARQAAYHTLLRQAMLGTELASAPTVPEVDDNFEPLRQLYEQFEELSADNEASEQRDENAINEAGVEALIQMTELESSRPQDLKELLQTIKTIDDPQKQAALLEELIKNMQA